MYDESPCIGIHEIAEFLWKASGILFIISVIGFLLLNKSLFIFLGVASFSMFLSLTIRR